MSGGEFLEFSPETNDNMHLGEEEFEYLTLSLNSISENNIVIIVIVALAVRLDFDSSYVQRERETFQTATHYRSTLVRDVFRI